MATSSGNTGFVKVADTDNVIKMLTWSLTEGVEILDDSGVEDSADTHLSGTTNWSGSVNCYWDPADTTGQEVLKNGTSVVLGLYADGDVAGAVKRVGTATISGVDVTSGRNATNTINFTFTGNGVLVESVVV